MDSFVVVDHAETADGLPRGRWPSNMPCQVGLTPNLDFGPIQFNIPRTQHLVVVRV